MKGFDVRGRDNRPLERIILGIVLEVDEIIKRDVQESLGHESGITVHSQMPESMGNAGKPTSTDESGFLDQSARASTALSLGRYTPRTSKHSPSYLPLRIIKTL